MQRRFLSLVGAAALAGGALLAQEAGAPPPARRPATAQRRIQKLSEKLNLTADQRTAARSIFHDAGQQARPIRHELRQDRQAIFNAVQSGKSQAEVDRLATKVGPLASQLAVVRSEAFAKFYTILTPEQRSQLNQDFGGNTGHHAPPAGE